MRLTILGGGGFRTPLVLRALFADAAACRAAGTAPVVDEVALYDVDPHRLAVVEAVAAHQAREHGRPALSVSAHTRLAEALAGADVVFSAVRVGGLAGRRADERVALAAGVLGQETVGAGGICYGLRTLPVAQALAEATARTAPGAWVINFTNPAGPVTEALGEVLGPRVVGICDSPVGLGRRAAQALGLAGRLARGEAHLGYAGLNHLGWLVSLTDAAGRDRLPELLGSPRLLAGLEEAELFGADWLADLGAIPNEYLHYFYFARETRAAVAAAARHGRSRAQTLLAQQEPFYAAVDPGAQPPEEVHRAWEAVRLARERSYMAENRSAAHAGARPADELEGGGYEGVALAVMRAVALDRPTELVLDVPNRDDAGRRLLPALGPEAVVEVPATVDGRGFHPGAAAHDAAGRLGLAQLGLVAQVEASWQDVIAAVRTGSRRLARRALATHPLVDSVAVAGRLLDAYLAEVPGLTEILPRP